MSLEKIIVAYDSMYGNTKLAAENIAEGMLISEGVEVSAVDVKHIDVGKVAECDVLVLGAPNHMARPSRRMMSLVNRLAEVGLKAKRLAVFGTYAGSLRDPDRAVKKMEKTLQEKWPNIGLVLPSLSVRVHGVTGPIFEGELERCREFGKRIANQVKQQ